MVGDKSEEERVIGRERKGRMGEDIRVREKEREREGER